MVNGYFGMKMGIKYLKVILKMVIRMVSGYFFILMAKSMRKAFFLCIVILQFGMVNIIHGSVMANTNLLGDLIMVKRGRVERVGFRKFQAQGSYLGGIKESKWEIFDVTAIKILEKTYDDGLLHGEMKSFFPKGKIEMIIHWDKGEKVSLTFWNYNGEEIKNKSVNEIPVMEILPQIK